VAYRIGKVKATVLGVGAIIANDRDCRGSKSHEDIQEEHLAIVGKVEYVFVG
jgi:hypothetical protein